MNNVKNSIGWADFTWNPITGCKRGCEYCYARKIHNRFNKTPFSDIVFHEGRLKDPLKVKKPSKIFVGSMSDIEYWKPYMIAGVFSIVSCEGNYHTYMFLSKFSHCYHEYYPKNTMQGLTETLQRPATFRYHSRLPRPFVSIEPIMGKLIYDIPDRIELIIVGAETGNRKDKVIPQKEWIQSIRDHVPEEKIYWKKNIKEYL